MSSEKQYVRTDEHGVLRVGTTRVMLDSVVAAFQQGHSPETIQQQYPTLSLAEVYGGLAYYLSHRPEVEAYLERQGELWEKLRTNAEAKQNPVVARLRQLRSRGISEAS
jgi:uncharacterized protein (DUF433 family)